MTSQFFGLDCEDHCACAPGVCNLFLGCSAQGNDTNIDHLWTTEDDNIESKGIAFENSDDTYLGFLIVFGILCIYSFVTTIIIIVMKIRRKPLNIVYRVGISPIMYILPRKKSEQTMMHEKNHGA